MRWRGLPRSLRRRELPGSLPRRELFDALLRRELSSGFRAVLVVAAAAGAAAAVAAPGLPAYSELPSVGQTLLARFHLTALYVAALLIVLRVPNRRQEDHATEWQDPYCAAGGSRTACVIALAAAVLVAMWLLFAVTSASYATGLLITTGSTELLRALPLVLAGGALVLAGCAVYALVIALLIPDALAAAVVALLLLVMPYLLLTAQMLSRDELTPFLVWWGRSYPPRLLVPQDVLATMVAVAYVLVMGLVATVLGRRIVARRP